MFSFLAYVSSATTLCSRADLDDILRVSRDNNARLGISGALLYKGGNFMQVVEGEDAVVRALYTKISHDPRHKGLLTVWEGTESVRQFPRWSMAFRDLDEVTSASAPGYSQFLNTPLSAAEFGSDPTACQQLLTTFKRIL